MRRLFGNVAGFTLMEVNIALLVVAVGLTSMMALFPVGLRESNTATADTVQSAAASYIFARLHANAVQNEWGENPKAAIAKGFSADNQTHLFTGADKNAFGGDKGTPVRYKLDVGGVEDYSYVRDGKKVYRLYYAALRVSDRKNGDIDREPLFYTEFLRKGMEP